MVGKMRKNLPPFKKGDLVIISPREEERIAITDYKGFIPVFLCFKKDVEVLSGKKEERAIEGLFVPILPPIQLFGGDK